VVNGYYLLLGIAVVSLLALWLITASPFGLVLKATRENRRRVEALGVSVYRHQLLAFTISGFFCALAGAMFVIHNQGSNAELFDWSQSGEAVLMAVIGGMYLFLGPTLGAFVYQFGHDWLVRYVSDWQLVLGLVLLLIVVARPDGLAGAVSVRGVRRALARITGRTGRHDA
jgi:branched-chain amino acid transport system permease protein